MKSASDLSVDKSTELCVVVDVDFPAIRSLKEESSSREASAVLTSFSVRTLAFEHYVLTN